MRARAAVWGAAVVAALLRLPGADWPIKADEAGFTLVARGWDPRPGSLYGTYWVDRPPTLIGLVKAADAVGGPLFLRLVAAVGCLLLVLAAAAVARVVCRLHADPPELADRMAGWTAVAAAAFTGNLLIDPVSAKGEILGIPVVMSAVLLAVRALERRSAGWAFGAGVLAMLAVGLKQSMVSGLVFGAALLVGSLLTRRLDRREFGRLAVAAAAGAAVPVAAVMAWALLAGVHLETVWYAVYGFRSDAGRVLEAVPSPSNDERYAGLLVKFVATGMALAVGWFLASLTGLLRRTPVLTVATLLTLGADAAALHLGGSYWSPYLFAPIPSVVLALLLTLELHLRHRPGTAPGRGPVWLGRTVIGFAVVSTVVSVVLYITDATPATAPPTEYRTGLAIGRAAGPEDTLVVYGGRADIQYASGLPSPYEHLWSLPMRTLDPDLGELARLLRGPEAPTWFVEWVSLDAWSSAGQDVIRPILADRYVVVGDACSASRHVFRRADLPRPGLDIDCTSPAFGFLG